MMLYTPQQPDLDSRNSSSFVKDCILPVGMCGCYFAYFVARSHPDLLHLTMSLSVAAATLAIMGAGMLCPKQRLSWLSQVAPIRAGRWSFERSRNAGG